MVKMRTYIFNDAEGFQYRLPQVDEEGHITTEAKIYANPWVSEFSDSSRCADCGAAGCFQGTKPDIEIGCPFEHRIPDIHEHLERAREVLREKKVFETLEKVAPEKAKAIDPDLLDKDDPDFVQKVIRYPIEAFNALRDAGLTQFANEAQTAFDHFMHEAYMTSEQSGPMHDIYGRICPDALCKDPCTTSQSGHGSIEIPKNMTLVADYAWESGMVQPIQPKQEIDKNIVVVGSGFAGLAAAQQLRKFGYQVSVVEKNSVPGEPGNDQILNYKVAQSRFDRYVDLYKESGIEFHCNTKVGEDGISLEELGERFNASAVILATGAGIPKITKLEGDAVDDVITWSNVTGQQQKLDNQGTPPDDHNPKFNAKGKIVGIIGTSDTAIDMGHTAVLQGAEKVIFISRRDEMGVQDQTAYKAMRKSMVEKGVEYEEQHWMSPDTVSHGEDGHKILSGKNMQGGPPIELELDMVGFAIGNNPGDLQNIFGDTSLPVTDWGNFKVEETPEHIATKQDMMGAGGGYLGTLSNGTLLMAAGDNVRGASLAAKAGRDAIDTAEWLHEELSRVDGEQPFSELAAEP